MFDHIAEEAYLPELPCLSDHSLQMPKTPQEEVAVPKVACPTLAQVTFYGQVVETILIPDSFM